MKPQIKTTYFAMAALGLLAAGCSSNTPNGGNPDATAVADSGGDANLPGDASSSSGNDAANAHDSAVDTGTHPATDAGTDAPSGSGNDAASDTGASTTDGSSSDGSSSDAMSDGAIGDAGSDGADDAGCITLTVKNISNWCDISVADAAFASASTSSQSVCVASGSTVNLAAMPENSGFELGTDAGGPWHETSGDTGNGDPGAVVGTTSSTSVVVTSGKTCVWACCPFSNGTDCPLPSATECP